MPLSPKQIITITLHSKWKKKRQHAAGKKHNPNNKVKHTKCPNQNPDGDLMCSFNTSKAKSGTSLTLRTAERCFWRVLKEEARTTDYQNGSRAEHPLSGRNKVRDNLTFLEMEAKTPCKAQKIVPEATYQTQKGNFTTKAW